MDIIQNLRVLEEVDDETAVTIIQLTLEDLNQLFEADQATAQQGTNSEARIILERQRDELQRHLRRRGVTTVRGLASAVAQPTQEPINRPFRQEIYEALGSDEHAVSTQGIPGAWPAPPLPAASPQGESKDISGTEPQLTCQICMDDFNAAEGLTLSCSHHCCRDCLNEIYRGATADESRYPPRCCADHEIDLEQSRPLLNAQATREFLEKAVEWETRNRTYCSNRNCGAFIRPENIRGKDARCTRCRMRTCADCKKIAHDASIPCASDEELQGTLRVLDRNRWRRCEGCRNGIERTHGCNHMICPCGRQFCYQCGLPWKTCQCPLFPDDMAPNVDQPAVPPQADPLPDEEMEQLFRNTELIDEDQFVLNGDIQDVVDDEPLAQEDLLYADGEWQDINDYEIEGPEVEDNLYRAEIDRRHEQELEEQRQRRERADEEDRQRRMARDREISQWREQIGTLRQQITQFRFRSTALHIGPRLSQSGQRALNELDDEIREMSDRVMAMELELEDVTSPTNKPPSSSSLTDTLLASWNKSSGNILSAAGKGTSLASWFDNDTPASSWKADLTPLKTTLSAPGNDDPLARWHSKDDSLARWDTKDDPLARWDKNNTSIPGKPI